MRSMTLDVDGPINVVDFGGTGEVVLLVHGLGGSHLNWLSVAPRLAERHHVYALDLPGFGRSPVAGRRSSIAANIDVLSRVIARLSDGPIVLIGNSMGGLLSIGVAAMHPEMVRGLVLVDPAVPPPRSWRPRFDRVTRTFLAAALIPSWGARRVGRAVAALGPEQLVAETLRLCSADPGRIEQAVVDAHVALEAERLAQPGWQDSFYAATRSLVRVLVLRRQVVRWLHLVTAPTLLVQGDEDRLVRVEAARAVASLRPDWEYHEFAGAGHVPMMEVPSEFFAVTGDWLARHGSAAAVSASAAIIGRTTVAKPATRTPRG
jgi:pimeloyl-ACP methyl ester carboxylesterase